jgi:predicted metalloprotease with PDZ domain
MSLLLAPVLALATAAQDTLSYSVALNPERRTILVEARLTVTTPGLVVLNAPPAAGPGRVTLNGFAASDERGRPLVAQPAGSAWNIDAGDARAVRFRYRLEFQNPVASSSTAAGLDTARLYAVTRALFVAPDPLAFRKTARDYPVVRVTVLAPEGWQVVSGWETSGGALAPRDGDQLLGSTLAAARDYRFYADSVGSSAWLLAIRGSRYFSDSTLVALISESLRRGAAVLGAVPVPRVTYTGEVGRKGGVSGSLQGLDAIGLVWEPSEVLELPRSHDTFHETLHLWFGGAMETERWWTEGVTDYYAARLLAEYREQPADLAWLIYQSHDNYQTIAHRGELTMSEEARRRLGGDNTDLLVYRKGMLAGLLLDAAIRRGSGGRRSLDDAARALLQIAATRASRVVRETEMREAMNRAGGREATRAWDRFVAGRDQITRDDIARALREVTGREFPPPLARKRSKFLRTP